MRMLVPILAAILFPGLLHAFPVYQEVSGGKTTWTYVYAENGEWRQERVALNGGSGWPELERQQVFHSEAEALFAFNKIQSQRRGGVVLSDLPQSSMELRGSSQEALWTVTQQWDWEWERRYSEWVRTELDREFWKRHGIATDCADVAYSAKWIFARIHGLPMANRLATGQWFTHRSVKPEWMRLPTASEWHQDKRFLAALDYLMNFTFTHSLWRDSYPIEIEPDSFLPGAHHLAIHDRTGHTQLVWSVGTKPDQVAVLTLNSSVPRDLRELVQSVFMGSAADEKSEGFLRLRWPVWRDDGQVSLIDPTLMPHSSREQFAHDFIRSPRTQFWEEVFFRLNPQMDFKLVVAGLIDQLAQMFEERVRVVEEGYAVCGRGGCPKGSAEWDAWSTPSRDSRLAASIQVFWTALSVARLDWPSERMGKVLLHQEGEAFTLGELMAWWPQGAYSSEPSDSPQLRWGVHPRVVAERGLAVIQRELAARDRFLQDHPNKDSVEIDKKIWKAAGVQQAYCQTFGKDRCQSAESLLRGVEVTADGRMQNVLEWMNQSVWFNSDARVGGGAPLRRILQGNASFRDSRCRPGERVQGAVDSDGHTRGLIGNGYIAVMEAWGKRL
ncbi:MAG: hypothetical protein AB7G93_07210 [Bdellovibrionales bacterium]